MTEIPRLSPTIAHKLTTESPLSAWAAHRLLGNFRKPAIKSQIEGRMWHAAVLGQAHDVVVVDAADFKTNAAKEERDAILSQKKIPVAKPKLDNLQLSAARIRHSLMEYGIDVDEGTSEKRFEWTEYTESGKPVECSGVIDHHQFQRIIDLKTSDKSVSLHEATNLIARSHSLLQDAAYRNALCADDHADDGFTPDYFEVIFAFCQTVEPFSVTPVTLSGEFRELSHLRWRRAIETWHECLSKGRAREHWPGPVDAITAVSPPGWMLAQEIEWEAMRED